MEQEPRWLWNRLSAPFRRKRYPEPEIVLPEEQPRPRWNSTTKVVVGVISFVLFAVALYTFRIVFVPLIIGVMMAYILQPVVRLIQRITRLPHGTATGLMYLILLALVIPIGALLIPVIIDQVVFLQRQLVDFARFLNTLGEDAVIVVVGFELGVQELVIQITSALTDFVSSIATESVAVVLDAARILLLVVFTFVIGFYLTRDSDKVVDWVYGLTPPAYRSDAEALMTRCH